MRDLTKLPHKLDPADGLCDVVVETPRGSRGKYDFDPQSGLFRLKSLLPEGMSFPLDFGFIPSTLCDDGDPLDVMVLSEAAMPVGALARVRLIAAIEAEEEESGKTERNDRLLAVSTVSFLYAAVKNADDLQTTFMSQLSDFWVHKAKLENKRFRVLAIGSPAKAIDLVKHASKALKKAA